MNVLSKKTILWTGFFLYLAVLIRVILLKYPLSHTLEVISRNSWEDFQGRLATSNFEPFKTITFYLYRSSGRIGPAISRINLLANLLAFVPLGIFLPWLFKRVSGLIPVILFALAISLAFETIQLVLGIGSFDVDDLILNGLGAIIGYLAYALALWVWRRRDRKPVNST